MYRKFQRENVPFATGVLYENDVDYRLARLLAAETALRAGIRRAGRCRIRKSV